MASSARQSSNSSGAHSTAMHFSGVPATAPSTSQNGNAGSVQEPSAQDSGFGLVHANRAQPNSATRHIRAFSFSMRRLVDPSQRAVASGRQDAGNSSDMRRASLLR